MQAPFFIKKVAVLGAGVMGAQIAAHCVNAGIETLLYDLSPKEGNPNAIVDKALSNLQKLKPSPLGLSNTAQNIQARNYDENLEDLRSCDLVIEAIAERLDWKESLYIKISPYLGPQSILVSNTSGLSINSLCSVLPEVHHKRFCGLHFFNPPRYMHLVELIPAKNTEPELINNLETWLTSYLGKGVVRAKDTPNFIANRVGVFSLLSILHHTTTMQMGLDEVDALTGSLLGRPKSASFRTMDVVGLDTMHHVVHTMHQELEEDPWHNLYNLPDWLKDLIQQGNLGQKTGQGIYRKSDKTIEVFDIHTKNYRPVNATVDLEVQEIMKLKDPQERIKRLFSSVNKQAKFLSICLQDLFQYSAFHAEAIADNVRDIDLALRWGFGWKTGPFETWQEAGVDNVLYYINQSITNQETLSPVAIPGWVSQINAFYTETGAYAPEDKVYRPRSKLQVYNRQFFPDKVLEERNNHANKIIFENSGVRLSCIEEDIALLSFKSKANTIGNEVLEGLEESLSIAEKQCQGIIIYQSDVTNFSSGADLRAVLEHINNGKLHVIETMISQFQRVAMLYKYSAIPTVAALRGRALGGGCELLMQCSGIVSAFESYPGLVEAGVGLIPAGGGCKEMALRAAKQAPPAELINVIQKYFEQIAMAKVAGSALEAKQMGYLQENDSFLMNADEVLYAATNKIKLMRAENYQPPLKKLFAIAGIEGQAKLQAGLVNWLEGGFITEHDYFLAKQLAVVLCGGDLYQGTLVNEEWLLKLELHGFMTLVETPLTQKRIKYLLETGKPLRN